MREGREPGLEVHEIQAIVDTFFTSDILDMLVTDLSQAPSRERFGHVTELVFDLVASVGGEKRVFEILKMDGHQAHKRGFSLTEQSGRLKLTNGAYVQVARRVLYEVPSSGNSLGKRRA